MLLGMNMIGVDAISDDIGDAFGTLMLNFRIFKLWFGPRDALQYMDMRATRPSSIHSEEVKCPTWDDR